MKGYEVLPQGRLGHPRPAGGAGSGKDAGPGRQGADRGVRPGAVHREMQGKRLEVQGRCGSDVSDRVGFWADMEHPYVTYDDDYIESEWWALKTDLGQGPALQGLTRSCPTARAAARRFPATRWPRAIRTLRGDVPRLCAFKVKGRRTPTSCAWTTTPWTLPSNVALCVNPDEDYVQR